MKKLLVLTLVLVSLISYGQTEGTPLSYSKVIEIPNTPKNQLYDMCKQWLASSYKSLNNVSQLDDKENGIFIGKGNMSWYSEVFSMQCSTGSIDYQIKLQVKDNKLKIELGNFEHHAKITSSGTCSIGLLTDREEYKTGFFYGPFNKVWVQMKNDTKNYFDKLSNSLETSFKSSKKDDF
jgi:hypothetical protein